MTSKYIKLQKLKMWQIGSGKTEAVKHFFEKYAEYFFFKLRMILFLASNQDTQHKDAHCAQITPSISFLIVNWNDRRSHRVFLCFYAAIFRLTSAKFQTFADKSRTVWSSYMKF